jgi:hypothetical protein
MKMLVIACLLWLAVAPASHAKETDHYLFVDEYIRELGATEDLRVLAEKELSTSKDTSDKMAAAIRSSTRAKLDLSTDISMLKNMQLNQPFETLIPTISGLYQNKIALHEEMAKIAGAFIAGPQTGVDYGAYSARMPEITAQMEFLDKTLFNSAPLIFAVLIDPNPDRQNHMSRLLITREQRQHLANRITLAFGKKLDQNDQNYAMSSASMLRDYLVKKGYKCTDEQ